MNAQLPPPQLLMDPWGTEPRQIVAALRSVRHNAGPDAAAGWAARPTASQARNALALAVATEGWSDEAKAAIDPNASITTTRKKAAA